jgi:hypothetical protein
VLPVDTCSQRLCCYNIVAHVLDEGVAQLRANSRTY